MINMLSNNWIKIMILLLIIIVGTYIYYNKELIHNEGSLIEGESNDETDSSDRLLSTCKNPQIDGELNKANPFMKKDSIKRVHFNSISECQDDNLIKQNKSVLPPPQFSNNYTPVNSLNQPSNGNSGTGNISFNPQTISKFKTVCKPHLSCYPKDTVTAAELLPREDPYNMWSQVNPDTPGHLADKNFLESGHHFGLNTVGNSLRNANQQVRSDPPIAQISVGPWNQSTIDPDTNRRAFEIGGDY